MAHAAHLLGVVHYRKPWGLLQFATLPPRAPDILLDVLDRNAAPAFFVPLFTVNGAASAVIKGGSTLCCGSTIFWVLWPIREVYISILPAMGLSRS